MLQLQQDKDFEHWGVDFGAVSRKAEELGIHLIRHPVFYPCKTHMQPVPGLILASNI